MESIELAIDRFDEIKAIDRMGHHRTNHHFSYSLLKGWKCRRRNESNVASVYHKGPIKYSMVSGHSHFRDQRLSSGSNTSASAMWIFYGSGAGSVSTLRYRTPWIRDEQKTRLSALKGGHLQCICSTVNYVAEPERILPQRISEDSCTNGDSKNED